MMASATIQDALLLFRQSVATQRPLIPTTSATPNPSAKETPLAQATHLQFNLSPAPVCLPLDTPTRYVDSNGAPFDLRSVYFAYSNHQRTIPEYNGLVEQLNAEFASAGISHRVHGVSFVERLELVTWLEGADECARIKPLEGAPATTVDKSISGAPAAGAAGASRSGKGTMDPRLAAVYNGERRMGDRNSILRGIKPTDFSHVRKLSALFLSKKPSNGTSSSQTSLPLNQKPTTRRPDPIILLSPSASSLLRLTNIKSFLESGRFIPPDAPALNSNLNLLHITRIVKDIDPHRPMRFILVEGCEQFKPDYWNRVVAVFTTGQQWQFKSYKWPKPTDLFKHVQGVYVGYRDDEVPEMVKSWGHRVVSTSVDRWRESDASKLGREIPIVTKDVNYRDREAADHIWKTIESNMRTKGWRRDACPTSI
ncbi:hypothetical protein MKZ38_001151 [Zalerion maritima]|uniref:Cell division control protein 73 C-terminal domain-containing protein n=1 Tax=Zalerion maritima TaxID=339359 RepID=A0AAD5WT97_9PEZI|nr:hypothetical protein MKZ38_001151 [Zalerion maritima]